MRHQARNRETAAMLALRSSIDLAFLGCRFERGLVGSVAVTLGKRALGAWWYQGDRFWFATTAFNHPEYDAFTVDQVVIVTNEIAAKHAMYLCYQEHGVAIHAGRKAAS